jgi:hypothetical protein
MKQAICMLAFLLLCIYNAQAQKIYYDQMPKKRYIPVAKIVGGSVAVSGAIIAAMGFMVYTLSYDESNTTQQIQSNDNTYHAVLITGLVMVAGGLICIANAPGRPGKANRYGLQIIAPKKNELGLAYNF